MKEYITPENQQFLFVPAPKEVMIWNFLRGVIGSQYLEKSTFNYESAKKVLSGMAPVEGSLGLNTPFIYVFQGAYDNKVPDNLSISNNIAWLYNQNHVSGEEILERELNAAFIEAGIRFQDPQVRTALKRMFIGTIEDFNPDVQQKIFDYNSVALHYAHQGESFAKGKKPELPALVKDLELMAKALERVDKKYGLTEEEFHLKDAVNEGRLSWLQLWALKSHFALGPGLRHIPRPDGAPSLDDVVKELNLAMCS